MCPLNLNIPFFSLSSYSGPCSSVFITFLFFLLAVFSLSSLSQPLPLTLRSAYAHERTCFIDVIPFAAHCQLIFFATIKWILLRFASVLCSFLILRGFTVGMCSWFLFREIKEFPCFMSSVTLTGDKGEMVVIRNKVPVTFEESF